VQDPALHNKTGRKDGKMNKRIVTLLMIMFVLMIMATPMVTSAETPVVKSVTLKSDNGEVVVRSTDDIKDLYDGDKLWSADGVKDYNLDGIVLIQNTKADTPNYYPVCELIIDLGEEKSIDTVNVTFYHYYQAIIDTPKDGKITVSYSIDGKSFSEIKTHTMTEKAVSGTAGIIDEKIPLGKTYKARAVMVSMTYGDYPVTKYVNEWFGFTELSAGMASEYKDDGKPTSSAASSASDVTSTTQPTESNPASSEVVSETSSPAVSSETTTSPATSVVTSSAASSPAAATDEGMDTWIIVVIVIIAAAVIAGIVYYFVRKNKNN